MLPSLRVAAGHVEPDGVSPGKIQSVGLEDVLAAAGKGGDKLDLVMDIVGYRRIGEFPFGAGGSRTRLSGDFWKKNGGSRSGS